MSALNVSVPVAVSPLGSMLYCGQKAKSAAVICMITALLTHVPASFQVPTTSPPHGSTCPQLGGPPEPPHPIATTLAVRNQRITETLIATSSRRWYVTIA